jgi:RNA polymerase sigma-70 factor (ECF subfamily)
MDTREFNRMYDAHSRKLYNYALWLTRNREAAQDVLQTVFVRAWKSSSVPAKDAEVEPWLFVVTRNACMDFFNSRKRQAQLREDFSHESPAACYNHAETSLVWQLLEGLKEDEKSILYLHLKAGYNYKEIGRIMHLEENAVRVRAFRAIRRLREKHDQDSL